MKINIRTLSEILFCICVLIIITLIGVNSWMNVSNPIVYQLSNTYMGEDLAIVPDTGTTGMVNLVCGKGTLIRLDDGSAITFPKIDPCNISVSASAVVEEELPAKVPEGYEFLDATTVNVLQEGKSLAMLPDNKKLSVSFADNASQLGTKSIISVIRWTESEWKNVSIDSRLKAVSSEIGVFVLVKH